MVKISRVGEFVLWISWCVCGSGGKFVYHLGVLASQLYFHVTLLFFLLGALSMLHWGFLWRDCHPLPQNNSAPPPSPIAHPHACFPMVISRALSNFLAVLLFSNLRFVLYLFLFVILGHFFWGAVLTSSTGVGISCIVEVFGIPVCRTR